MSNADEKYPDDGFRDATAEQGESDEPLDKFFETVHALAAIMLPSGLAIMAVADGDGNSRIGSELSNSLTRDWLQHALDRFNDLPDVKEKSE